MWPARAYFQAVVKDDAVYVIGGQDFGLQENPYCALLDQGLKPPPGLGIDPDAPCPPFLPTSQFFNDVWRSTDGITWEQLTDCRAVGGSRRAVGRGARRRHLRLRRFQERRHRDHRARVVPSVSTSTTCGAAVTASTGSR